ncbi:MAG TPA: translocation/assembly module TamB domain-containing protein [Pyrinomonadaceae bacterium]|nr:translocation/assembly module TamB domain-containing protein [Pyrinomonadaceae bacterium]
MPVDDRDERSTGSSPETDEAAPRPPQSDEGIAAGEGASASGGAAGAGEPPPDAATPAERRRRHRYVNRRNATIATVAIVALVAIIAVLAFLFYRTGRVDDLIARQIVSTLKEYNIRAEIKEFHTKFGPRTVEIQGLDLYDGTTGERLGRVERILATIRIEDMFALNLRRNINLESLQIEGLEAWVKFDAEGMSNFRNIRLPPPAENQRINFSYATARIELRNGVVHYGDERHEIAGEAKNLRAIIEPDLPDAPAESRMNRVWVVLSDSTFTYDGRPVDKIDIEARLRLNQTRAEIQELTLRSPVAEARLEGTMDDWRNLRYQMKVTSSVDLTQISNTLQTATPLRGAGRFEGTIAGEGDKFQVDGQIQSDALAAGNIRLKGLNATARGTALGLENYEAQGRAVAEMLTAGDFTLNLIQIRGGVMGTGSDFRFLGDLRAAAARSGATSIANLILSDAAAEYRDGRLSGTLPRVAAGNIKTPDVTVAGAQAADVRFNASEDGKEFTGSAANASAGALTANGARVGGITASGITATGQNGVTNILARSVVVRGAQAAGATLGQINVAGVRLSIQDNGRVQGSSGDINAGTIAFRNGAQAGRAENVRLARPAFVLEPSGRYRASADLSLGGGVLGDIALGAARSSVVATNSEIQLNNFTAEALNGRASGNAVISTARNGASRVNAAFEGLDVGGLLAVLTGRAVPIAGAATGTVNLSMPGTNFEAASGTLNAEFAGETGNDANGRTPLTGELALVANRGLFRLDRANLRTGASELTASGDFSFKGDSNLAVSLASSDAAELQRVLVASNLIPALEESLTTYGVGLAGRLEFDGTIRGPLDAPAVNGRAALATLLVNGRDLGALTASVETTATEVRVPDGRLTQREGGNAQFALVYPLDGSNNGSLEATLERIDIGSLMAALPGSGASSFNSQLATVGPTSGRVSVRGIPAALSGSADVRSGPGQLNGEPFDEIVAKATFSGTTVTLENLDARFRAGRVTAKGTIDTETQAFDLQAQGAGVNLGVLAGLGGGGGGAPQISGTADFNATATGVFSDPRSFNVQIDGQGRDVLINGQSAGTLALVGRTENRKFNLQLTTGILGQPQVVNATVDLASEGLTTTVETALTNQDLTQLFATLLPNSNVRVTGRATGTLRATGELFGENAEGERAFSASGLRGTAQFTQLVFQIADVQLVATDPLIVQFSPNEIVFDKTQFTGPGTNIVFGGSAALGAGGRQNFTVVGDLNLRVLNGVSPDIFLAGTSHLEVRVTGSFEDPRLTGTASLAGASFSTLLTEERLTVQSINGSVRFTANRAQIDSLTGTLGGGRVNVTGGALLAGFSPTDFRFNVRAENVTVPLPQDIRATADANLILQGRAQAQLLSLSGLVNLRRAEYTEDIELADFINRRREATISEGGGGDGSGGFGANLRLDLRVEGRDALVVRNNLADIVGSVNLQVRGSVEEPIIGGRVTVSRGTLNFRNDRYELTRAYIDLPARVDADPVLNIQAEAEIKGYRVIVSLTGPLSSPNAVVRSDPALPQSDVVALITTGDLNRSEEGGATLAQTGFGTATSLLTDTLINNPVQKATDKLFGLNRFEIDPLIAGRGGASPTARLTVGRQINRNLSLTYSTNVTTDQNQVLALEYRVSDRLSFIAQYEQGATNTLRSAGDNFSFEIRFRKRF